MTREEIIEAVRHCIDCEAENTADIVQTKDDSYMDNIIVTKIPDALHWVAMCAFSSPLLTDDQNIKPMSTVVVEAGYVEPFEDVQDVTNVGVVTLPSTIETYGVSRVRCKGWHKAVVPVEDTDDAALTMFDTCACGTAERPQAIVMRTSPLKILIQPYEENMNVTVSYAGIKTSADIKGNYAIPNKLKSAFIYYLAHLLLSAYGDNNAQSMYIIAMRQLGITTQNQ